MAKYSQFYFVRTAAILFFCLSIYNVRAGENSIDSLKSLLHGSTTLEQAQIYYKIGSLFFDSAPDSALHYFTTALTLSRQGGNDTLTARSLNKIGNMHFQSGEYNKAIENLFSALSLFQQIQDTARIMRCLQYLADAYEVQGMYDQALSYAMQSLEISNTIDDPYSQAISLATIGSVHYAQGRYDQALDYFQQALNIMEEIEDLLGISQALNNVALIYEEQHNLPKALEFHLRSLMMAKTIGDPKDIAASYHNVGLVYQAMGEYDVAIPYLDSCIILSRMGDDQLYLKESYLSLAGLYSDMGEYEKAYQTHLLYTQLNDTLMSLENKRQFAEMNTRYETEKKDQQIVLLDKDRKFQKTVRNGFVSGFVVVLLFAGVFFMQRNNISKARKRSDELLFNILPEEVADELKEKGSAAAKQFDDVTVMFTDIKDFTRLSETLSPTELVHEIHTYFTAFDAIISKHNIEKIKTIGDAYMCAGGLPVVNTTHATDVVKAAMDIRDFMTQRNAHPDADRQHPGFEIRIGIHTGPVVAGIVGTQKFAYDIWGDTVNIAARMESSGEAGKINISSTTYDLVKDQFTCAYRGKIKAKNKGEVDMYFVE